MELSKEEFVSIINRLKEADELQRKVEELFRNARDNIENDFDNGASLMISHESAVIFLLRKLMKDKYDNIEWWIYETSYGKHCTKIYSAEDHNIVLEDITSPELLYDYLMKCFIEDLEGEDYE